MGEDSHQGGAITQSNRQMQVQIQHPDGGLQQRSGEPESEEYSTKSKKSGNESEHTLISYIRVTNVVIRLRRIPVGFYVTVETEYGSKQTSNKAPLVGKDVVEWDEEIVLPLNQSSRISLTAFASFELGSTLGAGEALCKFEATVGELIDRRWQSEAIRFTEKTDGEVDIPHSLLEIKFQRRICNWYEYSATPGPPESEEMYQLRELTDRGHRALIRYRELQKEQDLEESIRHFERVQDLCPQDHPSRATVLFNLATAKLIYCRMNDVYPNLDAPIDLYRTALRLRSCCHPDYPFALLSLGVALEARFQRHRDEGDRTEGKSLLSRVLDVAPTGSYVYHAAVLALGSAAKPELIWPMEIPKTVENDLDDKTQRLDAALQWIFHPNYPMHVLVDHLGILFCMRLHCLDEYDDPQRAISTLEAVVQFTSDHHPDKSSWLNDLADLLLTRYESSSDHNDLETSISIFEDVVRLTPDGHPDKHLRLNNLSCSLSIRYEHFGDVTDLQRSVSLREDAVRLIPDGHPDKPLLLNNLSHSLSTRYERFGDVTDLERSIFSSEDALQLTPDNHSNKPSRLNNLGDSLCARYERYGDIVDLERSISLFEEAMHSAPDGHPKKRIWLSNLGSSLRTRYERFGDIADLERLIPLLEDVVQLTPIDHLSKPLHLNNLGDSLSARYERLGDVTDLERSIALFEDAVQSTSDGHPGKPSWLNSLGSSLSTRYARFGDMADLERSISLYEDAVRSTPDGHPDKPLWEGNLGNSLSIRYEHSGDINDLERAISLFGNALELAPNGHIMRPSRLIRLGQSLSARYVHLGVATDLERSISLLEDGVQLTPDDHPDKPLRFNDLGHSLLARYKHSGGTVDLQRAISLHENAVQLAPDSHPDKALLLNNLSQSLSTRYERSGGTIDLERAISLLENAVRYSLDGHPDKPAWLRNLGDSLLTRYERFGDNADLTRATSLLEDAMRSTPGSHQDKPRVLSSLSRSLSTRYARFGDVADLERSVSLLKDAVQLTPDGHPDKPARLNNLGDSFSTRYECFGDIAELERSISLFEDAVQFVADGHPDKAVWLNNLGFSLSTRYARFGNAIDLERSISLYEDAVRFTPDGHPAKPLWLSNLGYSLATRYERFGDVTDLERSISLREDALQLTPDDHPVKPRRLSNLGSPLLTHYRRFGDVVDLKRAISLFEDAVQFTPDGHPEKPLWLSNLGHSLSIHYGRFWDDIDLSRSISIFEDAVRLTPDKHPERPLRLNNLGHVLSTRYERYEDATDLERSISLFEDALQNTPVGHPRNPLCLNSLGDSLRTRHERFGDDADLERSISLFEDAVQCTPDGHPEKPFRLTNLALSFFQRARGAQRPSDLSSSDLTRAITYASHAARCYSASSSDRFSASQHWIRFLRFLRHDSQSLLDAYTVVVDLLPQLAWIGLSLDDRYHQLLAAAGEVCDAAATALEVRGPELAVEWLEQGCSIVWSQLSQLRTPVANLRAVCPELATRFERVSHALEHAGSRDRTALVMDEPTSRLTMQNGLGVLEKEARHYHALAVSREGLLAEIRALPGLERFLLPKTIKQLSSLAHPGPVIFLNASKYRCDALVVMADSEHVAHVPLSNTSYDEVAGMQQQLNKLLELKGRTMLHDALDRGARVRGMTSDDVFRSILSYLWKKVVSPILEALPLLSRSSGLKLSRIFWCPTGPFSFLPIHAAGLYGADSPGPKLSDFAVSSYIPTMGAFQLLPRDSEATSHCIGLLAVPQPGTDGQVHLMGVRGEIDTIRRQASLSPFVDFQEADGTVGDVLDKMTKTDWVHFACHGTQDSAKPYDSGFLLAHGKRLKLTDIARLSRPRGGLAFLSACHTATGDKQLSEEAIHIAGGMLLAGYRGVVATMWSILDHDAPRVVEDVYESLLGNGKVPDGRQAAEALHDAIERLRDSGVSFLSWVPFIHVGV